MKPPSVNERARERVHLNHMNRESCSEKRTALLADIAISEKEGSGAELQRGGACGADTSPARRKFSMLASVFADM
eukprot:3685125-Prymnesium_polylepis.1